MSEKEIKGFAIAVPIETIATEKDTRVVVNVQAFTENPEDMPEMVKNTAETLAQMSGAESYEGPYKLPNSGSKSFGFSWGNCKWEPRGPHAANETPPPSFSKPNSN